ncbi:hypothetical protein TNCT_129561 [Trichonephila clavata]|uniref:Uncharacterized protein n=1 Tax=Trichonephila clavata TaxID=2740835 RepID=A0A8X6FIC0_TRICU|nr:hypothetical protein TNCT_129561 [Trichonephila clavata]
MFFKTFVAAPLAFFAILCLNSVLGGTCPPADLILPCTCSEINPIIHCNNIDKPDIISDIFEKTGGVKFRGLFLSNSSMMSLPTSPLISEKFEILIVFFSTFVSLFDKPPPVENSLNEMWLMTTQISRGMQWNFFKNLTKLSTFDLYQTEIPTLGDDFQNNISPALTELMMVETKTARLGKDVFANLKSLSVLHIRNSLLKILKRSMFAKPAALKTFNFANNSIEFLPDDLFSDMPHLLEVNFSNNKIALLKEALFTPVLSQLNRIIFEDNPINCNCDFAWIVKVNHKNFRGLCQEPEFRKGKALQYLDVKDFEFC